MEAIKEWARSVYLLAVFSSAVLLIVPKTMQRQARFVVEMLMLLCVLAPLFHLMPRPIETTVSSGSYVSGSYTASLERFYVAEVERRVREVGQGAGIAIRDVEVVVTGSAPGFRVGAVKVVLGRDLTEEEARRFREVTGAYLNIPPDRVALEVAGGG
ncbi:MAG: hypothetical protein IMF26_02345 [Candidatus Fermentithermobacillus carboniphilus]|uniref:Stage III sporulation protein AF n=1 Tax=Candidatus Fermentithermobacillus carboniphilus TaxID=3085328 RepID=A0AAT9LDY2_9FIRM|nr:MAG: hypothetical protein IMF26_02345 [Candidatus Fermentithermobacillus carboniphilus]